MLISLRTFEGIKMRICVWVFITVSSDILKFLSPCDKNPFQGDKIPVSSRQYSYLILTTTTSLEAKFLSHYGKISVSLRQKPLPNEAKFLSPWNNNPFPWSKIPIPLKEQPILLKQNFCLLVATTPSPEVKFVSPYGNNPFLWGKIPVSLRQQLLTLMKTFFEA